MIEYENTCDPARIRVLAREALNAKLFVRKWNLQKVLRVMSGENINFPPFDHWGTEGPTIAVARHEGCAVGVACRSKTNFFIVFVRPTFRRQGIGRTLIERLKEPCDQLPSAGTGADWSPKFWRSCGIEKISPGRWRPLKNWDWVTVGDGGERIERPYLQRADGAYVIQSNDQYHSNPENPRNRMWTAFGPNGRHLSKNRKGPFCVPRKWATARAAAKALDREIPLK